MGEQRRLDVAPALVRGAAAGLLGVAVMTIGEKLEQSVTSRPNSYVPGRTLRALLGRPAGQLEQPPVWNLAMHYGTGALLGTLRGLWAAVGLRGPRANAAHTVVRLAFDQTLENVTGCGAPPHTWPVEEQLWDVAHKAVFSFSTGVFADLLVPTQVQSRAGRVSH
jgi:hypothetical protein